MYFTENYRKEIGIAHPLSGSLSSSSNRNFYMLIHVFKERLIASDTEK